MLNQAVRILNFDDSVIRQKNLLNQYKNEILNLEDIAPQARYWMNAETRDAIEKRISGPAKDSITFLGSGDFHHISEVLISQFKEPLCVIMFDFHPDWDTSGPRFNCGAWVREVLKNKNVLKFILLGVSSPDISSFNIQSGDLSLLKDNRLEIYPYSHEPSLVFFKKIPENVSLKIERKGFFGKIRWDELKNKNLNEFFSALLKRLPVKNVYVSIDKDCLKSDFALTNWEEGRFSLEELLLLLKLIKQNLNIVGLDITGDYSPVLLKGLFKKVVSAFDHPKEVKATSLPESLVTSINENTNLELLKVLNS